MTRAAPVKKAKKPKRPMSAYFIFTNEKREEVKAGLKEKENINKKLGQMWKEMSDEEKQPYFDRYKEQKDEIERAREQKKLNASKGLAAARLAKTAKK